MGFTYLERFLINRVLALLFKGRGTDKARLTLFMRELKSYAGNVYYEDNEPTVNCFLAECLEDATPKAN